MSTSFLFDLHPASGSPEVVSLKEEDGPLLRLEDGGKETCF